MPWATSRCSVYLLMASLIRHLIDSPELFDERIGMIVSHIFFFSTTV
jgi:hypothetical protein